MTGQRVGYIRVSTLGQNTARQLAGVELDRVFEDKLSGKDTNRPALVEMLAYVREGDSVFAHELSRMGRNMADLQQIVTDLVARGVKVHFVKENLVFAGDESPMNTLIFNMMASFSQFERSLINERAAEGRAAWLAAGGKYTGRKPALSADQIEQIRRRAGKGENKAALAREFNVSRQTIYSSIK